MLDIATVLRNPGIVDENCRRRGFDVDVDRLVELGITRRRLLGDVDHVRRRRAALSRTWMGTGGRGEAREAGREMRSKLESLEGDIAAVEEELWDRLSQVPNILDERVPIGGEEANVVLREVGEQSVFPFTPRPHHEIGAITGIIDIPRGVKVAGSRFYFLKNEAILMRQALTSMFFQRTASQGFEIVSPPYLARSDTLFASGYLPFQGKDNFRVADSDLWLIGTSEQALLGMHMGETLERMPLLYLGDSMCFRTEVGNYGRDTAGIIRVHQFYKLEQFVYCHPDESEEWHARCLENEEWLMQQVGVRYRVVLTASRDLGAPGRIKYDTEAWMPGANQYREMTSNTNMGDFQARRGRIRYAVGGEKGVPHTISATGFCDRLILAIIEQWQEEDGSLRVPPVLRERVGRDVIPSRTL